MLWTVGLIFLCGVSLAKVPLPRNKNVKPLARGKMPREFPQDVAHNSPRRGKLNIVPGFIIPPQNHPGEVIRSTDPAQVEKALSEVLKHAGFLHDRTCAVGLANHGPSLASKPKYWLHSGGSKSALPLEIQEDTTGLMLFHKTTGAVRGTVGVLTYDLAGTDRKVAVMWNVPFDLNVWDTWYNVKIYPKWLATNEAMYKQMYYEAGPWHPGVYHSRNEFGIKITTTMADSTQAKLAVWLNTTEYNKNHGPEISAECHYHPWWFGYYCYQETYPLGACWVNRRCNSNADCASRQYACY